MKTLLIGNAGFFFLFGASAQQGETAGAPKANDEDFRLLEAKIRQAWEDYKKQEQRSLQTHFYRGRN